MKHIAFSANLSVVVLKEKKRFVAYAPALDLSTSGKTLKDAKDSFTEAAQLFFEGIISRGTLGEVLEDLGWEKTNKDWKPPAVVSPGMFSMPIAV